MRTPTALVFLMRILSAFLSQPVVTVVEAVTPTLSRTDSTQQHEAHLCVLPKNRHTSSRNVIRYTSLEHYTYTGHVHSFLIFDTNLPHLPQIHFSASFDPVLIHEPQSLTGYEPKQLAEYQDLAEHEDLRVNPRFFHRPSVASTYVESRNVFR